VRILYAIPLTCECRLAKLRASFSPDLFGSVLYIKKPDFFAGRLFAHA